MDLGSTRVTGMVRQAHDRLVEKLGFGEPGACMDMMQQLYELDEQLLEHLGVDVRGVSLGAPDSSVDEMLADGRHKDEWGVIRVRPEGSHYYDLETCPLAGDISVSDIAKYPWPDPTDPGRFRGLRERARRLHEETDYAVVYNARYHLVHQTQYMRGFEDWYCDLGGDHDLFRALMDAVLENLIAMNERAYEEVADYVDIVSFGDDVGLQDRPVCSPPMYRELIRPYQERITDHIRKHTNAKIFYHTCGSVNAYIPDFIELGINALNPVQVSAKNMDPERLAREFGGKIAFWGAIDTQHVLPHGSPEQVRAEVRRVFDLLGQNGGYILAAVHNIQPDVPPENILAMFGEGRECLYPVLQAS